MINRGKEWAWMNKLNSKENDWCHYSGMPSPNAYKEKNMKKKRKVKRTLKVKIIRFFQDETTQRILEWLLVIGLIILMSNPWAK
jgi:hypothetical protein